MVRKEAGGAMVRCSQAAGEVLKLYARKLDVLVSPISWNPGWNPTATPDHPTRECSACRSFQLRGRTASSSAHAIDKRRQKPTAKRERRREVLNLAQLGAEFDPRNDLDIRGAGQSLGEERPACREVGIELVQRCWSSGVGPERGGEASHDNGRPPSMWGIVLIRKTMCDLNVRMSL